MPGIDLQDGDVLADLEAGVLEHALGDAVVGVGLGRGDDRQALELRRIGDRLEVLRHAEIVRALNDGADHDARAAGLARHLHHGGVADGEVGRAAEHRREGLGVAAGGGDDHLQAVLLEDAGVHADIEVDVAEIVHRLDEVNFLHVGSVCMDRSKGQCTADGYAKPV